jgi:hypothetical protein
MVESSELVTPEDKKAKKKIKKNKKKTSVQRQSASVRPVHWSHFPSQSNQVSSPLLPLKNILMVKKPSGTDEGNGGTTLNKSASVLATNP